MIRILFAFVSSVGRNDAGYYTCSSSEHPSKSALVTILGNAAAHIICTRVFSCFSVECKAGAANSAFSIRLVSKT